jgi:NADH:ubiquinone oxidoreductase subunit 4 (subunit M)
MLALLIGFGTKMPIYPFYNWLPEAHTETPTSFSIILSGISIKFAFIGYFRFIY